MHGREQTLLAGPPSSRTLITWSRVRVFAGLAPLFLLLILWLWAFYSEGAFRGGPSGKAFGADWAMFVGAAQVMNEGGNPYDHIVLYRTEKALLAGQGLPITEKRPVVRVGNPPLFFWALRPLAGLPFRPVACTWMALLYALSAAGFLALLRYLGWSRRFVPLVVFLAMPQVVTGAFYGNVIGVCFAAIAFGLLCLNRRPLVAGALLSLAWLKPPVALPIVFLIILFHPRVRKQLVTGFVTATAGITALTILLTGTHSLQSWITGLLGYSRDMSIQPDVASLAGLYVRWAPSTVRVMLELLLLGSALAITAAFWRTRREYQDRTAVAIASLWCVWMLATPYAHFFDEMLLAFPMLVLVGKDAYRITWRLPAAATYFAFLSLMVMSATPFNVHLLPVPLLAVGVLLLRAAHDARFNSPRVPPAVRPS